MSDLISRQDLRETMYEEVFLKDSDDQRWDSGCWIRYKTFERVIDSMPTIDAVPVKHGEWLPYEFCTDGTWDKCSVCGVAHRTRSKYTGYIDGKEYVIQDRMNYCPICGAKMDGGKDDE